MKTRSYIAIPGILFLIIGITLMTSCSQKEMAEEGEYVMQETEMGGLAVSGEPTYKNLVNGKNISLEDMKGHVIVVNYWATWCPSCRAEIPGLVELYDIYKDRKFTVIGVSVDKGGEEVVNNYIHRYKISYPVIMNTEQLQSNYEKAAGNPIRAIPTSIIINREGEAVSAYVGFRSEYELEQEIKKLL
jgi:cytochrome c biogenesis protein CcmG/thiol:disulfide interchange protein DsbE